jgi:hypothetical protein
MNKSVLIGGLLTLALTACAGVGPQRIYTEMSPPPRDYTVSPFFMRPNPTAVNVLIVEGNKIVIDQEPIRPPGNQEGDAVVIFFILDDQNGRYAFPPAGVIVKEHENFCTRHSDFQFKCKYRRPAPDEVYHYKVKVLDRSPGGRPINDLDPTIMN